MIVETPIGLKNFTMSRFVRKILGYVFWSMATVSVAEPATIIYDVHNTAIVSQQGSNHQRSIASLTKLMTAMVVIDSAQSMVDFLPHNPQTHSWLPRRWYTRHELLNAMLVKSDNGAAETLAANHPGGRLAFVQDMNNKAKQIGMSRTQFNDPSGLSVFNVSTLDDIVRMIVAASSYNHIRSVSTQPWVQVRGDKKTSVTVTNTAHALFANIPATVVAKTGYTNHAGYCAVMLIDRGDHAYVLAMLGANSRHTRDTTMAKMAKAVP